MAEQSWGYDAPPLGYKHMRRSEPPEARSEAKTASFSAERADHLTPRPEQSSGYVGPSKAVSEAVRQIKHVVGRKPQPSMHEKNVHYSAGAPGAETQYSQPRDFDTEAAPQRRAAFLSGYNLPPMGSMLNFAGGILSLILLIALGGWGYKLAMRDVSGIPVVRALEGPMRVQPDDPGGQIADHQGLAVNAVQADGQAAAPADLLTLAPLPEEIDDFVDPADWEENDGASLNGDIPSLADSSRLEFGNLPDDPVAAALALAEQVSAGSERLGGKTIRVTPSDGGAGNGSFVNILPASVPGVRRSPLPSYRPRNLDTTVRPSAQSSFSEADSAAIPTGTRLVQLGAFDSPTVARSEWDRLFIKFGDYMEGKTRVVQQAQTSGKTFYRLRVMGFSGLADAKRFCSVLKAQNAACIPLVTR